MMTRNNILNLLVTCFLMSSCLVPLSCMTLRDTGMATAQQPAVSTGEIIQSPAVDKGAVSGRETDLSKNGPLRITVEDAVMMSFENNRSLAVERLRPSIQKTGEELEQAAFDPVLQAGISARQTDSGRLDQAGRYTDSVTADVFEGTLSLEQYFPAGTFLEAFLDSRTTDSSLYADPYATTRLGLTVTQALLRGYGTGVNLARLRQSQIDTQVTMYELHGFSEFLLAQVETAYWDYALSLRQIEIVEQSLELARQHVAETEEMIRVGTLAESELAAVQAEVAAQHQGLIDARSNLETNRLKLIRLLNPPGENFWDRDIELVHPPAVPEIEHDKIEDHVAAALEMRPEMNQARLSIKKNELETVRTKNGLLPRMDLFITLGKTGYADSFSGSVEDLPGNGHDMMIGINLEYPFSNRAAGARHRRALLSRDQAAMALENLEQVIELDVRTAYIELNRTREQISASTATRRVQEEKLRIETEKYRVGRSTSLFVAQVQHDLLVSRINEIRAVVNHLKAIVQFYRLEGTLLERRGITTAG